MNKVYTDIFYNQADAKGKWGNRFTEGLNPNYNYARFTKASNINEIHLSVLRFARYHQPHVTDYNGIYAFTYMVLYADSLYCCVYAIVYGVV